MTSTTLAGPGSPSGSPGSPDPSGSPGFLRSKLGGLPRPFWALWAGTLVNRVGMMVQPFIGVYLIESRGMSLAAAGTVMTVFGAGSLISQVPAGWLADRYGRRITLAGGMTATAAGMAALGASSSFPAIVASMFVLGLAIDAYRPASNALVADLVSPADRPRAYGLLFWALNLGFSVAMVAGGWLARAGYGWMFAVNALTSLAFGLLVWRAVPETLPRRAGRTGPRDGDGDGRSRDGGGLRGEGDRLRDGGASPGDRAGAPRGGLAALLGDRLMVVYCLISLLYSMAYSQAFTTLPVAMSGSGFSTVDYGLVIAVNGVLIVVLQPLTGDWVGRRDPGTVFAAGLIVISAGFALTAFVSSIAGYAAGVVVWTLGEILTAGLPGAIVAILAPPHLRGRYAGMYGLAMSGGAMLAPLVGTHLLTAGPVTLWLTVGGVNLAAAAGLLAIRPALRRRAASQEA
ncbi:MFS transporter [Streptosporangium sandarakinum]|uniref:MFS family permease n=1 Tax=Streptosporangium sandarakinum TaxID=1260955 RepID=A0A852UPE0_9ACTN|nr:MFS transporter [Streptosporangium sandarakinum]NYF38912.1 MFS family permease [Streptosporangium sandarakinum]